jgi:16S rRNA (guanine966-N2)-methyltransferase
MIRITGGKFRGRSIASPPRSKDIRPTTSLIRESIFSRIQHEIPDCRFLDLFAGSGIMGLEALSRGAQYVLGVDADATQCRLIRKNYEGLGLPETEAKIITADVKILLTKPCSSEAFDIVFMDPPYGFKNLEQLPQLLQENGWLKPSAVLMIEHGSREADIPGFNRKMFGDSSLSSMSLGGS